MHKTFGFKYVETQVPNGKPKTIKTIFLILDGDIVGEFVAKDCHKWLKEKAREMGEWLETGKVQKWYEQKQIRMDKVDKDRLRYMG